MMRTCPDCGSEWGDIGPAGEQRCPDCVELSTREAPYICPSCGLRHGMGKPTTHAQSVSCPDCATISDSEWEATDGSIESEAKVHTAHDDEWCDEDERCILTRDVLAEILDKEDTPTPDWVCVGCLRHADSCTQDSITLRVCGFCSTPETDWEDKWDSPQLVPATGMDT
jgi:hypothetical protein